MSQHLIERKIQSDWHIPLCVRSPDLVARSLLRAPTPPNLSLNLFAFLATEQTWPHTRLLPVARSSSFQLQRNHKIRSYLGNLFCLHGKWSFHSRHFPKFWNLARTGISSPFEQQLLLVLSSIEDVMGWAWVVLRVRKNENFPDSKMFVAKTFRIKRANHVNFQISDK